MLFEFDEIEHWRWGNTIEWEECTWREEEKKTGLKQALAISDPVRGESNFTIESKAAFEQ